MKKKKPGIYVAIVVCIALGASLWGVFSTFSGSGLSEKEKAEVIRTGIPAVATLLSVERTGNIVNSIHQYGFYFKIQPDSGNSFTYSEKKLMDPIYMPSVKMGMEIPAYISTDKERKTVILWKKVGIGDAF